MNKDQGNKLLAEFMGHKVGSIEDGIICVVRKRDNEPNYIDCYSDSLNALLPVIDKIINRAKSRYIFRLELRSKGWQAGFFSPRVDIIDRNFTESPTEAAFNACVAMAEELMR